jgi:hypothetical protein
MHGLWRCGGVVACDCGGVVVCGGPVQKGVVYGGPVQKEGPVQKVGPVQKEGAAQKGEAAQKSARVIILDHSPVAYRQVSFRR